MGIGSVSPLTTIVALVLMHQRLALVGHVISEKLVGREEDLLKVAFPFL